MIEESRSRIPMWKRLRWEYFRGLREIKAATSPEEVLRVLRHWRDVHREAVAALGKGGNVKELRLWIDRIRGVAGYWVEIKKGDAVAMRDPDFAAEIRDIEAAMSLAELDCFARARIIMGLINEEVRWSQVCRNLHEFATQGRRWLG